MKQNLNILQISKPASYLDFDGQHFEFVVELAYPYRGSTIKKNKYSIVKGKILLITDDLNLKSSITFYVNKPLNRYKVKISLNSNKIHIQGLIERYKQEVYGLTLNKVIRKSLDFHVHIDNISMKFANDIVKTLKFTKFLNIYLIFNDQIFYKKFFFETQQGFTNFFEIKNFFGKIYIELLAFPDGSISQDVGKSKIKIY